jgi:hypothetical protein
MTGMPNKWIWKLFEDWKDKLKIIKLAAALILFIFIVPLASSGTSTAAQDQPGIIKASPHVTARTKLLRQESQHVELGSISDSASPAIVAAVISTTSNTPSPARGRR